MAGGAQASPAGSAFELPAPGFPISAEAVTQWLADRTGRTPSGVEVTEVLNAMAARDSTAPADPSMRGVARP